jgi:hypothetical protein
VPPAYAYLPTGLPCPPATHHRTLAHPPAHRALPTVPTYQACYGVLPTALRTVLPWVLPVRLVPMWYLLVDHWYVPCTRFTHKTLACV